MLQAPPFQLVFRHDMILSTFLIYDYELIRILQQELMDKMTKMKTKPQNTQ